MIWGKNNDLLHVLGGTNGINGYFYSLDFSNLANPKRVDCDTLMGFPQLSVADAMNAENISDNHFTPGGVSPLAGTEHELLVFPNPSADVVRIKYNGCIPGRYSYRVTDIAGRIVKESGNIRESEISIRLESLPPGIYLVHLIQDDEIIATGKISVVR